MSARVGPGRFTFLFLRRSADLAAPGAQHSKKFCNGWAAAGPVGVVFERSESRWGVHPLASGVNQLCVFRIATLGSRGRLLGAPHLGSERLGAVRPEQGLGDRRIERRRADRITAFGVGRIRNLRAARSIHSEAFAMPAHRSVGSLLFADHIVADRGAAMTLSRVPSRTAGALAMFACAVLLGVPAMMAVEMSRPSVGPARAAVDAGIAVASLVGLMECLGRVVLGCRWKFRSKPTYEIADLCSWPAGFGSGRRLLDDVCDAADSASVELVLRVRPHNERAIELYRQCGFAALGNAEGRQLARMIRGGHRSADSVPSPGRLEVLFGATCGLLIVVVAWTIRSTNSDLLAACCLVGGLGALARGAFVDIGGLRLPNFWTALALLSGVAGSLVGSSGFSALLGIVVTAVPFTLLHLLDPEALGFGDVKFAAAAGAVVAIVWWPAATLIVVAALASSLVIRLGRPSGPRAFGPNLMGGTLIAVLFASALVSKGIAT